MKLLNKILSMFGLKAVKKEAVVLGDNELKALDGLIGGMSVTISTSAEYLESSKIDPIIHIKNKAGDTMQRINPAMNITCADVTIYSSNEQFMGNIAKGVINLFSIIIDNKEN